MDYTLEDLKGLMNFFSGKYKYDYNKVKHLIKAKGLKNAISNLCLANQTLTVRTKFQWNSLSTTGTCSAMTRTMTLLILLTLIQENTLRQKIQGCNV
ncbi:MAG TPA: hypothetical protein VM884_00715 [Flavisolibacter sp.]|nr:hypothetical protein [Flavisolibacter sp.]